MTVETVPAALVREELARLTESDVMRRAPSHRRLLAYLVDKALDGDAKALRESAIAFEVFRRDPASFDAQVDPIVRVTARRLRDRLDAHYAHLRPTPRLRIRLPKGGYRPEFVAPRHAGERAVGIAVQSTRNVSGDVGLGGCCATFADRLADSLARAGLPRVIARASVVEAESRTRSPGRLAHELAVGWCVESTLTREHKNDARLSVRMVSVPDMAVHWVESIAGDDVYDVSDRMLDAAVLRAASTMQGEAGGIDAEGATRRTLSAAARARLDALRLMLPQRTVERTDEARAIAEALSRDFPEVADVWAWRAAANYSRLSFMDRPPGEFLGDIKHSAARALEIEPDHPVALRTLAIVVGRSDGDGERAETLFRHALRAMPHYTSARLNYAELLALQGRSAETRAQLNLALIYDPLSVSVQLARAACYAHLRLNEDVRDACVLCRAGGETSQWLVIGEAMNDLAMGNLPRAESALRAELARRPDSPATLMAMALVDATAGRHDEALALERLCLARYPHYSPAARAGLHAVLGEREVALDGLAEAAAAGDMTLDAVLIRPTFDTWIDEPRFRAICERRGLRRPVSA